MPDHTDDRLKIDQCGGIIAADGERFLLDGVALNLGSGPDRQLARANARRLVALWNACRGIETKQLQIVATYESDEARLSWLAWSAEKAGRPKEPTR